MSPTAPSYPSPSGGDGRRRGLRFGLLLFWLGAWGICLAGEWRATPWGREREAAVAPSGQVGFSRIDPLSSGLTFTNRLSADRYATNQIYLNGSGVAAGDADGDGLCDLYFCNLDGRNALWKNLGGWKFRDVAVESGVDCAGLASTGAVFADVDGDGDLDLIVNSIGGGTRVFINDGRGRFAPLPPLNLGRAAMSIAVADIDGDGDLDVYVANYRTSTIKDQLSANFTVERINGRNIITKLNGIPLAGADTNRFSVQANGQVEENGEEDALFINDGHGRFEAASFTGGRFMDENGKPLAEPPLDWGLSAMFRDMNGDGAPDLYVCNDFKSPDRAWINDGAGRFRAIARTAIRSTSLFSMGIDFADLNRDGFDEFIVLDMQSRSHVGRRTQLGDTPTAGDRPQHSRNSLYLNRGDSTYAEIGRFAGLEASEWSWTPAFMDVDLDGYEDLLVSAGHESHSLNADASAKVEATRANRKMSRLEQLGLSRLFPKLAVPHMAFRNKGDMTFEETGAAWGFSTSAVSHGMVLADLDNDGDLDVAINSLNGPAELYRNESGRPRMGVRLKGAGLNTRGIGSKMVLTGGAVPQQSQEMVCGGRYLSGDDSMRVFAAGSDTNEMRLEIRWRSGKRSLLSGIQANRIYEIDEEKAEAAPALPPGVPTSVFEDATPLLGHVHRDEPFDDFAAQPSLPRRLSQLGPGASWHDVNGDGWEDLIVGGGRGGTMAVFLNDGKGGFAAMTNDFLKKPLARDQTTILGFGRMALVGSANYEDGRTNGGHVRIYDFARQASGESILGPAYSSGPLAMADIDGDGDLDLFVGGRVVAGQYPKPAGAMLLKNEGGKFVPTRKWEEFGLASGAAFSDVTGDEAPDLIVACEWGPVRVFENRAGQFTEVTRELGFAEHTGFWNGVATGDFDGDGRLDIVASNWGLNTHYRASARHPRKIYYGDFAGDGTTAAVETYFAEELGKEVPDRDWRTLGAQFPWLRERVATFGEFAHSGVGELFGESLAKARRMEVSDFASTVFLNRGTRFEARPLPMEAQLAPAFGVCVGDMDGDGNEDVFLSQNFFGPHREEGRNDAGRGLWLKGNGAGGFRAMPGQESGIKIHGEQRGCALADFDHDGRTDLMVAQNSGETKLYRNRGAKPGLRVTVRGNPGNPEGIGAKMRLLYGTKMGPVREIQAGSGYWSQNGSAQVLGMSGEPTALWTKLPGSPEQTVPLAKGAREIEVGPDAEARANR